MRLLRCHIRCHQQVLLIFTAPNHYNYTIAQKISRFVSYLHFCYVHFCQIMLHHLNYYITIILHILHDLHFNCIGQNCNSRTLYAHYHRFIFASGDQPTIVSQSIVGYVVHANTTQLPTEIQGV